VSPWLFGSVEPWAWLTLTLLLLGLFFAWAFRSLIREQFQWRASGAGLPLLLFVGLVTLQTVSLPPKAAGPVDLAGGGEVAAGGEVTGSTVSLRALSAAPFSTRRSLAFVVACVGLFLIVSNRLRTWSDVRFLLTLVLLSGFSVALFGLIQKFSGTGQIYWYRKPAFGADFFGPFANKNHFAGYLNLAIGSGLALLLGSSSRRSHPRSNHFSMTFAPKGLLIGFMVSVMAASVCVSLSRGGIVSLAAGFGVAIWLLAWKGGLHQRAFVAGGALLAGIALLVWMGWGPFAEQIRSLGKAAAEPLSQDRVQVWRGALGLLADHPITGTGLGTFRFVFPRYKSAHKGVSYLYAHNDYLQLACETGLVGLGLGFWALIAVGKFLFRSFSVEMSSRKVGLMAGLAAGVSALLVHEVVDFNLHIPANALLFSVTAGMLVAVPSLLYTRRVSPRLRVRPAEEGSLVGGRK